MARNTKLTQGLQDRICDALKRGHYMRTAAPLAGVSARSAQSWLARGRVEEKRIEMGYDAKQAEEIYLDFLLATEQATSQAVDIALQTLQSHIAENPKAAQWYLSHRFSGTWVGVDELEERIESLESALEELG